jgi:hypothetical protein
MIVELATGNLPWKNVQDMNQVGEYKKRCRQEPFIKELFGGCPREFVGEFFTRVYYSIDSLIFQRSCNTLTA